ncbi:MAG: hypothetical protein LBU32_03790 [Clostridiales bacterium]|nr:hypothetical protein [Clostridiales bacterium]
MADEFILNNDNDSEGKKGGKGGKSDTHSVEKKKADKDGESARIARMAADAGILAASMGIGRFLALDRHFMSETAFLISERLFGGAAGAAARAKLGSAACEPTRGRAGKSGGSKKEHLMKIGIAANLINHLRHLMFANNILSVFNSSCTLDYS